MPMTIQLVAGQVYRLTVEKNGKKRYLTGTFIDDRHDGYNFKRDGYHFYVEPSTLTRAVRLRDARHKR